MTVCIFLDESGDLGWSFNAPYRAGGSSRYVTIAALVVPDNKLHIPERVIRGMYTDRKWSTKKEKKWSDMSDAAREDFASRALKMSQQHPDIQLYSIVVKKVNVQNHLRADSNLLYNYMLKLSLLDEMAKHDAVKLVPDPRTIKVQSGNSQHEYLQITLWYEREAKTVLTTKPEDSKKALNIQFADMLSGVVQSHFEDGRSAPWEVLSQAVSVKRLFF